MLQKVDQAKFLEGEHQVFRFWRDENVFQRLLQKNSGKKKWSFLDGPITANNPMGVHHAWGRTYKDAYQRYFAMTGHELRYQNGFDCQGLWVEVEVEKELKLGSKRAIEELGIEHFTRACKKRVLKFAARQTEQSQRLGYWMEWDDPDQLRHLAEHIGSNKLVSIKTPKGREVEGPAEALVAKLGNPEWGGSYFTFSTENNETIWTFLKKCHERGKIYLGHDVMPWGGNAGSAYSQMEIADGRKLTIHKSVFVRFPLLESHFAADSQLAPGESPGANTDSPGESKLKEYLLIWTTTPWTLTSNVACMINPDLDYVRVKAQIRGDAEPAIYYFAKENLHFKRLEKEFKEGFGRPEWHWPAGLGKLKTIAQIFKEQGGFEELGTIKGAEMENWRYSGPFDELEAQNLPGGYPRKTGAELSVNSFKMLAATSNLKVAETNSQSITHSERFGKFLQSLGYLFKGASDEKIFALPIPDENASLLEYMNLLSKLDINTTIDHQWENTTETLSNDDFWTQAKAVIADLRDKLTSIKKRRAVDCHRIVDAGRDFKGNAIVVAGEGTGIVHSAPGCGDVDHKIGMELGLPPIAPLLEDGTFGDGFGDFTGKKAVDPATVDMVLKHLRDENSPEKNYLVAVETYPHIYPHCWRTGEELVFRLVDEWFINMDWRDEIKSVTECINWIPESIQGKQRELEWLDTMRDWMISKKRYWGLALPIWVDVTDPSKFVVFGSIAELKQWYDENGGQGWGGRDGFDPDKHTPHRPWIDRVLIRNKPSQNVYALGADGVKTPLPGNWMKRIQDVGNPWLDAGIVPFSTMSYNSNKEEWAKWFPADLVTECFPGQFRNWFYSLLSLATMMRYDETAEPELKKPFKNLLGHRLVMDEAGQPMHKSDGTAIWFEEAAEQIGVDTLRWMYLAQNPASDLRFGTRHPHEPVTLETPEGPISETKEGLPTCKVTSTPADNIRRQVLIPLWNSYAFFVNYAVLDGFDTQAEQVPLADRPEIDRWVLSRLQELTQVARDSFESFNAPAFMQAATEYIDDLSNWYIRRNRRRFWKSVEAVEAEQFAPGDSPGAKWDCDKLAAYQTLYVVLVTLSKLLAPAIPFLAERMYRNLVVEGLRAEVGTHPVSVHLCDYPEVDSTKLDLELNARTQHVQTLVKMGHRLREASELRVRQPLAELRFACANAAQAAALEQSTEIIADELNVKRVARAENLDDLVNYSFKPNLKTLGPKCGKLLGAIRNELPNLESSLLAPLRNGASVTVSIGGETVTLEPEDVLVSVEQASDWASADADGIQIALSTNLTEDLIAEGMARDLIRQVQQLRKEADLEENQRISIQWAAAESAEVVSAAVQAWQSTIQTETRADSVTQSNNNGKQVNLGDLKVALRIS